MRGTTRNGERYEVCLDCGTWGPLADTAKHATMRARELGWVRTYAGGSGYHFRCPDCRPGGANRPRYVTVTIREDLLSATTAFVEALEAKIRQP